MKRFTWRLLFCSFYLLLVISCTQTSPFYRFKTKQPVLDDPPYLQVLLVSYKEVQSVPITLRGRFEIRAYDVDRSRRFTAGDILEKGSMLNNVTVRATRDGLKIGGIIVKANDVVIIPTASTGPGSLIKVGTRPYRGRLRIKALSNKKLALMNIVDMETYLYGVVSSEMNSAFPPHALSAQAVAARTFALFRIKRAQKKRVNPNYDFDVTDDIFTQVYRGEERSGQKIYAVVDNSRGVILTYQGRIFESIFHDTCGGRTEPVHLVWSGPLVEPLKGRICGYCYDSRFNHWQVTIPARDIITKLKLPETKSIENIRIVDSAPGGHARTIGIKLSDSPEEIKMNAQKFRIALDPNKLYSTRFEIKKRGQSFEFTGRGWGHGVGLCQEGARGMAEKGFNTLEILEYYYLDTRAVKIY